MPLVHEDFPEAFRNKRGIVPERTASPCAKDEVAMRMFASSLILRLRALIIS